MLLTRFFVSDKIQVRALKPRRGFTLIEMLVVLLIMGLFVGLVTTITQPDDRALLHMESERLARLLDLAATKSHLTGKPVAWSADAASYRFWQFNDDTSWTEVSDDDTLRARALPPGMKISSLTIENRRSPEQMRLEFTPYGQTNSFGVEMSLGTERSTIAGSPIGDIYVVPRQEKKQ